MKYDSKQISKELEVLRHNKDLAFQQYHKICGAIEMLEAMHKEILQDEQNKTTEKNSELELVPENNEAS